MVGIITDLAPWSVIQLQCFIDRKLSFYIDFTTNNIQEVLPDEDILIEKNRKEKLEMNQQNLNMFQNEKRADNKPKFGVFLKEVQSKLWRK